MSKKLRIIILGEKSVGKTSLHQLLLGKEVKDNPMPTLQIIPEKKNGASCTVEVYDTPGDRVKGGPWELCFNRENEPTVVLLVFDLGRLETLENLKKWIENIVNDFSSHFSYSVPLVLIGNKSDLEQTQRSVTKEVINTFKSTHGIQHFFETSAKNDKNVDKVFHTAEKLWSPKLPTSPTTTTITTKRSSFMARFSNTLFWLLSYPWKLFHSFCTVKDPKKKNKTN
eukprot:m.98299 g.98299  ORF g.98299 m.98299 type:complete len:226 (+) comp12516_c1_seq2:4168-4845(+)